MQRGRAQQPAAPLLAARRARAPCGNAAAVAAARLRQPPPPASRLLQRAGGAAAAPGLFAARLPSRQLRWPSVAAGGKRETWCRASGSEQGGEPGRPPVDKLAPLQEYWSQLDPKEQYALPPDATISRLAAETGLQRLQVLRFFERRLVPLPEELSESESDSDSELEPWDFGFSAEAAAASSGQSDKEITERRDLERKAWLGKGTRPAGDSDDDQASSDEEEELDEEEEESESDDDDSASESEASEDEDAEAPASSLKSTAEPPADDARPKIRKDGTLRRMPSGFSYGRAYQLKVERELAEQVASANDYLNSRVISKRRALLYNELEAKLIKERKEKKEESQRKAAGGEEVEQLPTDEETPGAARPASLIDAIVQGQVGPAELTGLAEAPEPAAEASPVAVAKPRRKRPEKAVRGPRKRRKRRYFWLVHKNVRTPGMRTKLFEGEWVEEMDKYDVEQAASPEERALLEAANRAFQKELKTPLPEALISFNDLPVLPIEHDIVYQHEDWEEDGRIAHRSLEVGDLLSGVVVDQYLYAGAFVDCCCEYNGIIWVSQRDWPGVEDTINLGKPVDVVVTAVRDPALYRFPLELQCVDPDLTGLLPNTKTPKEVPLIFPLDTTAADLDRIAAITGRAHLSPKQYARMKQEYRRHKYRGSQLAEQPRRDTGDDWVRRHGVRPPAHPYPPRPFRAARAPSTKKKTRKTADEDSFSDAPGGDGGDYADEGRTARWDE